ncbi:MAG: hypothetical protein O2894_07725, partial [Planctomycetota bacterium]|nr:hypothetical protein [Planctomycetota bacterium]
RLAMVMLVAGALGACGGDEQGEVVATARLDAHRTLGAPIHAENLTVWPIYTDKPIELGDFLTLQEAQEKQVGIVRELDAEGAETHAQMRIAAPGEESPAPTEATNHNPSAAVAAVPAEVEPQEEGQTLELLDDVGNDVFFNHGAEVGRVVIENKGTLPILVVAGTIIQGGNQDRQIGQDFVIAAGETVDVDAFCVEQGRWGAMFEEDFLFEGELVEGELADGEVVEPVTITGSSVSASAEGIAPRVVTTDVCGGGVTVSRFSMSPSAGVAPKQIRAAAQYEKDQGKVWEEVEISNAECGTENDTSTLFGALAEVDEATLQQRAAYETRVGEAFARLASTDRAPIGFAYAINGKPVTVRTFAHARLMRSQLPLFLKAMAIEAQIASSEADASSKTDAAAVIAMVRAIEEAAHGEWEDTAASNRNGYRQNDAGFNARCALKPELLEKLKVRVGSDIIILTEDWTAR